MSAVAILAGRLEQLPNVLRSDLNGAVTFMDALREIFDSVHDDVFIDNAVLQLTSSNGYSVGHITFGSDADAFRFIPYQDKKED